MKKLLLMVLVLITSTRTLATEITKRDACLQLLDSLQQIERQIVKTDHAIEEYEKLDYTDADNYETLISQNKQLRESSVKYKETLINVCIVKE